MDRVDTAILSTEGYVPDICSRVLVQFRRLWLDQELTDYVITSADGDDFHVHKAYVAAASEYFHVMLTGDMLESHQNQVTLKGLTAMGLAPIIDYLYGGKLQLNDDNIADVFNTAAHLQIKPAIDLCSGYLEKSLSVENCLEFLHLSHLYSLAEVKEVVDAFILAKFRCLVSRDLHTHMTAEDLMFYTRQDALQCHNEAELFHWLKQWVEVDIEYRLKWAGQLMQNVRFPLIKHAMLQMIARTTSFMTEDPTCRALLKEAEIYHDQPTNKQVLLQNQRTEIRNQPTLVTVCGNPDYYNNKFVALNKNKWHRLPPNLQSLSHASGITYQNFLIACGGGFHSESESKLEITKTCFIFDPRFLRWSEIASMNVGRIWFPLVCVGEEVYAICGTIERMIYPPSLYLNVMERPPITNTNIVERYSFHTNRWETVACLDEKLRKPAACIFNGCIYISGGFVENVGISSKMYCLDPKDDMITEQAGMLRPHFGHTMTSVEDSIYILDLHRHPGLLECYQAGLNQWSTMNLTCRVPSQAKIIAVGEEVYFVSSVASELQDPDREEQVSMRLNLTTQDRTNFEHLPDDMVVIFGGTLRLPYEALDNAKKLVPSMPSLDHATDMM